MSLLWNKVVLITTDNHCISVTVLKLHSKRLQTTPVIFSSSGSFSALSSSLLTWLKAVAGWYSYLGETPFMFLRNVVFFK
jgi:hypothetical protein